MKRYGYWGGLLVLLLGCGGAKPPNKPPTAIFTVSADGVEVGKALSFDASASSDPDGDALVYSWEFGDGERGGSPRIAHRFDVPVEGRYLLRATGPTTCCWYATVWGPSAPHSNYTGEFTASYYANSQEVKGLLRAGANTLTLLNTHSTSSVGLTALLVTLEPPTDITPGGATLNGSIDTAGERDYYRFTATANQNFTLNVSGGFAGTVRVYKLPPNGDYTAGSNLPEFNPPKAFGSHSFTIPSDGTYLIEVDGSNEATGDYSVSLSAP